MANGGSIPTNITQRVYFYNTTGVIERHKNIYFVPRFSKYQNILVDDKVNDAYLDCFSEVCPPSSVYSNIDIGVWNPMDRRINIKGNADDFRIVTTEGACLNYFIIRRSVTKIISDVQKTEDHYYAFFITAVRQAGGGSIDIEYIPDDFTNAFYLHNHHVLTQAEIDGDYEPFNEKMKNCYVNRQHYNRVSYNNFNISTYVNSIGTGEIKSGDYLWLYINQDLYGIFIKSCTTNIRLNYYATILFRPTDNLDLSQYSGTVNIRLEKTDGTHIYSGTSQNYSKVLSTENENIFKNIDELFKYKYQYKNEKTPLSKFNDIRDYIHYLVLELKGPELMGKCVYQQYDGATLERTVNRLWKTGGVVKGNFQRPNPIICLPFISAPQEVLSQYGYISFNYLINQTVMSGIVRTAEELYNYINTESLAEYILNAYIVKDLNIPNSRFSIVNTNIRLKVDYPTLINENEPNLRVYCEEQKLYPIALKSSPTDDTAQVRFNFIKAGTEYVLSSFGVDSGYFGLLISGFVKKDIKVSTSSGFRNPKNVFYEQVLELEPYSFYSISYLSFEAPFNSSRYYYGGTGTAISVSQFVDINNGVKMSLLPYYNVETNNFIYINDGLTFTITHSLPLVSSSYSEYYYQNMAQMKNQFAVIDKNMDYDFLQHLLISGPNSVGYSAGKGGSRAGGAGAGFGALLETGNQVMQMADEVVDYFQNKQITEMNQKAKLADMGTKPDAVKQTGSDVFLDIQVGEDLIFINHYTIDNISYNSIAKLLERIGYQVNLYDSLNVVDRVGWNFIKLNGFDFVTNITVAEEKTIRDIFSEGVTLLHDKSFLTAGHNYETILEE